METSEKCSGKCACGGKKKIIMIVCAVVLLGAAFYAGAKYEKSKLSSMGLLKTATTAKQSAPKTKVDSTTAPATQAATNGAAAPAATTAPSAATPATPSK